VPYSESVPKIFLEIKDFAAVCAKFAKGLNVRYGKFSRQKKTILYYLI
jgi:hypothetical protein